jgi:O-antigen ligase
VLLAADQGGFFPRTWPWAALAFAVVAALVASGEAALRTSVPAVVLVGGTAALAGWTALSALWSTEPPTSLEESVRTPVYVAAALALTALAAAGGSAALLAGMVGGASAIAAYSLADRLLNGPHLGDRQQSLLERPLGYANALGILCALALVVLVGLGVPTRGRARAVAVAACAAVLVTALALTQSRASWAAAAAGLAVAAAVRGRRRALAVAFASLAGLALASASILTAFTVPARLQARGDYWHVAWRAAGERPLLGWGAGAFDLVWGAFGDLAHWRGALDAHSLYLETLAELGVVGVVLLASFLVPVVAAFRASAPSRVTAAALGGSTAFLFHAGLDWDWEMPAVTVAGLVCLAAAASAGRPLRVGRGLRAAAAVLALATAAAYVGFLLGHRAAG